MKSRSCGFIRLADQAGHGTVAGMTTPNPYHGFLFPAEVSRACGLAVLCLSLRDVETILAARRVMVSYVT